jgi:hypothetical protein
MNAMLQWELDWVMEHADRYGCPQHAKAVCGNITKRYYIAKAKRLAADYRCEATHANIRALFDHLEHETP